MPRKNTTNTNKKTGKEKHKTKVGERGKKKPKPSEAQASPGPVATTEGEFLEALRKEFFACLAEQDVTKIKGMIDREFKARRRLEKVKNKRFDPFTVFKQSGLGSVPFNIITTQVGGFERRGRPNKPAQSSQEKPVPTTQNVAVPSMHGACDYTPLHLAVLQCDLQAAKQLTKDLNAQHLVIDKRFQTPLYLALQSGNRDLLRYMSECRNSPNALKDLNCGNPNFIENWNETFVAAFYGNTSVFIDSMAEPLLYSPHLVDKKGRTLFHVLAMHDDAPHIQMMRVLARKCLDNTKNQIEELEPSEEIEPTREEGNAHEGEKEEEQNWGTEEANPHYHYEEEHPETAEYRVDNDKEEKEDAQYNEGKEADTEDQKTTNSHPTRQIHLNWNARAFKGGIPLHVAAYEHNIMMTEMILKEGGVVNRPNPYDGRTALHYAVERNSPNLVTLLLNHSATKDVIDAFGRTPLQLAHHLHFDKVVDILEHYVPPDPQPKEETPRRGRRPVNKKDEDGPATPTAEEDNTQQPSRLMELPTQLLVRIAEYLTLDEILELGFVSRRLRHIAKAEALWNKVDLNAYCCRFPSVERFKKFTYYHLYKTGAVNVRELNLHPKLLLQEILFSNGKLAQKLEDLAINTKANEAQAEDPSWIFDISYLNQLLTCCPRLVSLRCTSFSPESESEDEFKAEELRRLKRFHFGIDKDSKKLLDFLSQFNGGSLEDLRMAFNTRIARANEALFALSTSSLKDSLIAFEFRSATHLSEPALQSLAAFGNLQKLVLRVNKISADTLLHIVQGAGQHLQTLKVSVEQAEKIDGGAGEGVMAAILKAVPQLTSLSLSGGIIEDKDLISALSDNQGHLRQLTLTNFVALSDDHIEVLARSPLASTLQTLRVKGAQALTQRSVGILLGSQFTQLESLQITDAPLSKIHEDDFERVIVASPRAGFLRRLELSVGSSLDSQQLTTLLMSCPRLEYLALHDIVLTDHWFRPSFVAPSLRVLLLQGDAKEFGDYGLSRLAYSCPALRRFEVICPATSLSRASVHHVLRVFPHLETLRVPGADVLYAHHVRSSPNPSKRRLILNA